MSLKISVPYSDKNEVKQKGAFWDSKLKTWYIPNHKNLNDFLKWIDTDKNQYILKTPIYIAHNYRECWCCNEKTKVISLYSDNSQQFEYDNFLDKQIYSKMDSKVFFFNITFIGDEIQEILEKYYPFFKLGYSKTIGGKYWASHCTSCDSLQGDNFNHCEPGAPFYPLSEVDCKKISLKKYSLKYDLGLNGNYSSSTMEEEIFNLSRKL